MLQMVQGSLDERVDERLLGLSDKPDMHSMSLSIITNRNNQ